MHFIYFVKGVKRRKIFLFFFFMNIFFSLFYFKIHRHINFGMYFLQEKLICKIKFKILHAVQHTKYFVTKNLFEIIIMRN